MTLERQLEEISGGISRLASAVERLLVARPGAQPDRPLPVDAPTQDDVRTALAAVAASTQPVEATPAVSAQPRKAKPVKAPAPEAVVKTPDPVVEAVVAKLGASFLDDEPVAPAKPAAVERKAPDRDDVRAALVATQKAFSPDEAFALLKAASGGAETIGAKTAQNPKGLAEDQFGAVIAAAVEKVGGVEKLLENVRDPAHRTSLALVLGV